MRHLSFSSSFPPIAYPLILPFLLHLHTAFFTQPSVFSVTGNMEILCNAYITVHCGFKCQAHALLIVTQTHPGAKMEHLSDWQQNFSPLEDSPELPAQADRLSY